MLLTELERWGLRHVLFDQTGPPPAGADLVWIEAPSNPLLTMPDFEAAAAHPGLVVCDATAATPVHLRPLEHGCDLVAPLGDEVPRRPPRRPARRGRRQERRARRPAARVPHRSGIVAAPDPAWLLLRGLQTLEVRVTRAEPRPRGRSSAGSRRTRRRENVRYPGFGALLSFDVADGAAARRVETATQLIVNATSLGGVTSTMESRHRWEGERVPEGLLRLSVGLEPVDALWADLEQALASA